MITLKNEKYVKVKEISPNTLLFIDRHTQEDVKTLALQRKKYPDVDFDFALQQIDGKRKAKDKFPFLVDYSGFWYPKMLSVEQASSELTAKYKAELLSGEKVADITGGMGIDDFFISQMADSVSYVEQNHDLAELTEHNRQVLQRTNMKVFCDDGIRFLENQNTTFDYIYLDPARRNHQQKVFFLQDCEPNILEHLDFLFSKTSKILLKASPMLDISKAVLDLKIVKEVHVVGVKNECKELLFCLSKENSGKELFFKCVNLFPDKRPEVFSFMPSEETTAQVSFSDCVKKYVYEPNVCLLKAGAFKILAQRFSLQKFSVSSHFYTSDELIADFPGRIFQVQAEFSLNKESVKTFFPEKRANIIVRNFPMTANEVAKKFALESHEKIYLLLGSLQNGKKVALKVERLQ